MAGRNAMLKPPAAGAPKTAACGKHGIAGNDNASGLRNARA